MSGSASLSRPTPWRVGILIAASCGAFTLATATAVTDPDTALKQLRSGDYAAALTAAQGALTDSFNDRETWDLIRLEALMATGQYPEALTAAQEALAISPRSLTLKWAAREVFLTNGDTATAQSIPVEIQQLVTSRGGRAYRDVKSIVVYGQALMELGEDPKAILDKVYAVAAKMDPAAREPLLAAGQLALQKNDFALAAKKFQAALKTFPDDPDILCGLALAFASSDRLNMTANLEAALKINPAHVPSLLRLADHLIDAEKYDEARGLLDRVEKVNPHRPELAAYRAVLAHLKNDPAAESAFRAAALKFWPTNPLPDHLIGRKLSQKYRFAEGAARQRQALTFDSGYLPAQAQLASDLLRLGEEEEGWQLAATVQANNAYDVATFNLMTLRDAMTADFTTLKNGDFTVRMKAGEAAIYGPRVLELLGSARQKLSEKYGVEVTSPTIVEIFPQQKDFGVRTFGMPDNPGFLGVCFGRVVTAVSPAANRGRAINWEAVLWHEFCHTVTLQATHNKMPRWLSEGISVYEERQADPSWGEHMDVDYREKILGGKLTPIASMSSAFLAPPTPADLQFAYYQASLVVEFLIDRYSAVSLKAILTDLAKGTPINEALATRAAPLETLERDFAAYARDLAGKLGPALNWDRPDPMLLLPGAEAGLATWAKERPANYWMLLREADQLMESEQWAAAKVPLQTLLDRFPALTGPDSAWSLLARVHRELQETEAERAVLTRLTALDAAAPEANLRLAALAAEANDWPLAERQARRVLAVNPLFAAPWRVLAGAAEKTGQTAAAIQAWRTLLQLDPPNPADIHYQLARLLHQQGSPEARREVLMALEETPRHRAALKLLQEMPPPAPVSAGSHPHPEMKPRRLLLLTLLFAAGIASAQRWGRRGDFGDIRTAREVPSGSTGTPTWEYPDGFKTDVFTFARIRYERGGYGRGGGWATDLPDSDLNLSWRLQQMTSMKVDPDARIIRPTDPELADYPFIYIVEPGALSFTDEEVIAMRKYLENGGFLLLDDFWGEDEWENCEEVIKQVLPNRSFSEIPLTHPLYRSVFTIKEKAQVPNINLGAESEFGGSTAERYDAEEVHHRAIFDDKGRPMVIALHNTDNGDGWEREGESAFYFKQFSERTAYPLAINIIFYVMTH